MKEDKLTYVEKVISLKTYYTQLMVVKIQCKTPPH